MFHRKIDECLRKAKANFENNLPADCKLDISEFDNAREISVILLEAFVKRIKLQFSEQPSIFIFCQELDAFLEKAEKNIKHPILVAFKTTVLKTFIPALNFEVRLEYYLKLHKLMASRQKAAIDSQIQIAESFVAPSLADQAQIKKQLIDERRLVLRQKRHREDLTEFPYQMAYNFKPSLETQYTMLSRHVELLKSHNADPKKYHIKAQPLPSHVYFYLKKRQSELLECYENFSGVDSEDNDALVYHNLKLIEKILNRDKTFQLELWLRELKEDIKLDKIALSPKYGEISPIFTSKPIRIAQIRSTQKLNQLTRSRLNVRASIQEKQNALERKIDAQRQKKLLEFKEPVSPLMYDAAIVLPGYVDEDKSAIPPVQSSPAIDRIPAAISTASNMASEAPTFSPLASTARLFDQPKIAVPAAAVKKQSCCLIM